MVLFLPRARFSIPARSAAALFALIAQLVEHGSNKPRVGGSSPSWSTFFFVAQRVFKADTDRLKVRLRNSSSLEVEHRSYEPGVAGSIPAWSTTFFAQVRGKKGSAPVGNTVPSGQAGRRSCSVTVITGDSESLNPGSIPGRTFFFADLNADGNAVFFPLYGERLRLFSVRPYAKKNLDEKKHSECKFRSYDLWVMSPTRFRCANSLVSG